MNSTAQGTYSLCALILPTEIASKGKWAKKFLAHYACLICYKNQSEIPPVPGVPVRNTTSGWRMVAVGSRGCENHRKAKSTKALKRLGLVLAGYLHTSNNSNQNFTQASTTTTTTSFNKKLIRETFLFVCQRYKYRVVQKSDTPVFILNVRWPAQSYFYVS